MEIITLLEKTLQETVKYYELPQNDLQKTYATGKWTIRKILIHLADAEGVLHERVKRIIAEPKQIIQAFDQDLWCANLEYEIFPLELSKSLFVSNRKTTIYLANRYYIKYGDRTFVHSQTGLRTLKEEFDKIASHNQEHINQIKAALSGK